MKIVIKGTRLALTPALQAYVKSKLAHLDKLGVRVQLGRVELEATTDKNTKAIFRAEVNLDAGKRLYRAETEDADMYAAIDLLVPKLVAQIEKVKLKKISADRKRARRFKDLRLGSALSKE